MSSTAPMRLDQQAAHDDGNAHVTEGSPATASTPTEAPAQAQTTVQTAALPAPRVAAGVGHEAINTSWGGIVLAVFALLGGLGLWTVIAVSGSYFGWWISVGVMGVIVAVTFIAIGYAYE